MLDCLSCFRMDFIPNFYIFDIPFVAIGWESVSGKYYSVYVKSGLTQNQFLLLEDNFLANSDYSIYIDQGGGDNNIPPPSEENGARMYKVTVKEQ